MFHKGLQRMLLAGIFSPEETTKDNRIEVGILNVRTELKKYYTSQHKLFPGKHQSRIGRITSSMLGPEDNPCLHAKGAESRGTLGFVLQQLMLNVSRLDEQTPRLIDAGLGLKEWYGIHSLRYPDFKTAVVVMLNCLLLEPIGFRFKLK
jgi:hypothetical protein